MTGEPHYLRDEGLLDGALSRPFNLWLYDGVTDVVQLAIRMLLAIANAHAFEQGNKRTGYVAAQQFIWTNGFHWNGPDDELIAEWIIAAITESLSEYELVERFRMYVV